MDKYLLNDTRQRQKPVAVKRAEHTHNKHLVWIIGTIRSEWKRGIERERKKENKIKQGRIFRSP